MPGNVYIRVHRRQAAHRRRTQGLGSRLAKAGLALGAVLIATSVVREVFLEFLDQPPSSWAAGAAGLVLRLGLVVVGLAAIDAYDAVLRGQDRDVLGLLPVEPGAVIAAALWGLFWRRWWTVPACAVLVAPLWIEAGIAVWGAVVGALLCVQILAWPLSVLVFLVAVHVADSPATAPALDLLRGANPRQQAAFIYAPGAVLVLATGALWLAVVATRALAVGDPMGLVSLLPILGIALVAALALPAVARSAWFRAGSVLAEIDASWAALDATDLDVSRVVYLEWTVRFFPRSWRRRVLHDLRHGWRGRRSWISGAWVLGLAAAAVGWTEHSDGPARALIVACLGIAVVATIIFAMDRDEPEFLRWWLPAGTGSRAGARGVAVMLWVQPLAGLAGLAAWVFGGLGALGSVWVAVQVVGALLIGLALLTARLGRAGPWAYAPAAAAVVLCTALISGGAP